VPLTALILVILAAFSHSTWNLLAKRGAACRHLIWFSCLIGTVLLLPAAAWIVWITWGRFGFKVAAFLLATGVLHVLYTECLLRGYRAGDLSVVYPLARGTGPLLSFCGAVVLLREHPSLVACLGALFVVSGVLIISNGIQALRQAADRAGIFWGVLTGITIASYTLNDGYLVKVLLISPILVDYTGTVFRVLVLSPRAWRDRAVIPAEFRRYWPEALGISVLSPTGYILVLFAMQIAPVSHVAPAREMSMMIGAYFGTKLLSEGNLVRRMIASALIAAGVAGLALG
jgi:uncharacterized membrane protein